MNEPETSLPSIAIHEAGHAVATVRFGIQHGAATIQKTEYYLGKVETQETWWSEKEAGDWVLIYCAGYGALVAAGIEHAEDGTWNDFENAEQLIESWCLGSFEDWKARSVSMMSKPENVYAVQLIAERLLEKGTLCYDEIEVLVDVADGETTIEEYEQFVRTFITGDA